ncbi:hypothetical protein Q9Q94_06665 [Uliginosibacterium sp. 31-16]|uniref:hypothetical protein n=1 Tax=Uliginosibacterium sp. 31-16 TaxID=3068315 RepID=UPI00273EEA71|nr:hypothetical protein [Uliginosibacterium sp. 31-16]MDP5239203.1 hypothetical protein [Uliginosibacterium sp. 31-16]
MSLDSIELHDAVLKGMEINVATDTISISLDYYPNGNNSRQRCPANIRFEGVSQHSQIADFAELKSNARAGNIVSWAPSPTQGTTFIYLARGLISVTAQLCHFISAEESA